MRQVSLTIGGKPFTLRCEPGDETRVSELGIDLDHRVSKLARDLASPVNERLLVLAALMLLDELREERAKAGASPLLRSA
jgi:cell division protein ZapA